MEPGVGSQSTQVARRPDVLEVARQLSIDPAKEPQWMWIAEHARWAGLPEGWVEFEDDGAKPAFYHPKTKRLQVTHPVLDKFKAMFEKQRSFAKRSNQQITTEKLEKLVSLIINEVLNRCNRELPPVTPEIVEKLSLLFNVNTSDEFQMSNILKTTLDEFAEEQYELAVSTHERIDILTTFIDRVRREQVRVEVLNKADDVVMCQEFPEKPAVLKDLVTFEFYCKEGFDVTHATGKRKNHETAPVEQTVCSVYPRRLATCEVEGVFYSDEGYRAAVATNPGLRMKWKKILGGFKCAEYPVTRADVLCEDSLDFLSWEGYFKLYRRRVLTDSLFHNVLTLDESGRLYRMGEMLPLEESGALIDKARAAAEGGPWVAFQDDRLDTYWYHFSDKVTTRANPYFA